jgi:hypothetical protein
MIVVCSRNLCPSPSEEKEMQDLERVRVIEDHYRGLRGLRSLRQFLWVLGLGAVNPVFGLPQGRT